MKDNESGSVIKRVKVQYNGRSARTEDRPHFLHMIFVSIYQRLYYRLYMWSSRYLRESDIPEFYSLIWLTVVEVLNVITVITILEYLIGRQVIPLFAPSRVFGLTTLVLLGLLNYWIFLRGEKYKKLVAKYKDESDWARQIGNILTVVYVFGSILFFFVFTASTADFNK